MPAMRTFTARRAIGLAISLLFAASALALPPTARAAGFTDIGSSPFRADIEWLAARGVTRGCTTTTFCPRQPVTRGQMASFLVRMFGFPAAPAGDPFRDDDASAHEGDINRLYAAGITAGCGPGRFCPNGAVTREQMASFLVRALGLRYGAGNDYVGDDDGSSHEGDIDRLFFAGVTGGCDADRVCPRSVVTREQMAAFLHRSQTARPIGVPGFAGQVTYADPVAVAFIGPARFRGVTFSADGSTATQTDAVGTILPASANADQSILVSGVAYAHLADGPMAGSWVKADLGAGRALGRAPAPPACAYADVLTSRRAAADWGTTLLDTRYMLPRSFVPGDLVGTSSAGLNAGHSVRSVIKADLAAMAAAARSAGAPFQVTSAYRSYDQQIATFRHWVSIGGMAKALLTSARPGHSEHQLGTTLDLTTLGGAAAWKSADWAKTPAGAWIAANSWRYGFLVSYPRGETASTCYSYEPWHVRYVGRPVAAAVRGSGMTLREAIWAAYGP
jgi:D-alanyl-D-alanine carboxypeptidase